MALQTDPKNKINALFPGLWSGKYFLFTGFIFLLSCTILSLELENLWIWSFWISTILLVSGMVTKNITFSISALLPVIVGLLLQSNIHSISQKQASTQEIIKNSQTLTGIIVDIWNVKKWQQRATLELLNHEKIYTNIPAHSSILLSREMYFKKPSFRSGSLFQLSRGIMGEITFSSFELWEIQKKYYLLHFKSLLIEKIRDLFPPPESALLNGILVGDDSLMDEDFSNLYRKIGLSHITVVSGSNIAAILAILAIFFQKFSTSIRVILSLCWIWCYVILVGTDPPVLRALVMGSISLFALAYGKQADSLRILLFAAVILVALSPLSLVYDSGFQLSFLATIGILVSVRLFKGRNIFIQAVGVSIFAGIWTLPISIWSFGTIHTWSVPANILVGPAVEISMFWWALALLADTLYHPLGYLLWYIPYFTLFWIQKVAEVLSELPLQIQFYPQIQAIFAFFIFGLTVGLSLRYLYLPNPSVESSVPSDPR